MGKFFLFFSAILILPVSYAAPLFKEGIHYETLANPSGAQPEVLAFFSFFCPNCAIFEPILEDLKSALPEGVPLKKNHVAFLGRDMGPTMQRAYAVAKLLNVEDKLTAAIFHKMQQRQHPRNLGDLRQIFVESGVPADTFDGLVDSFAAIGMVSQFDHNTEKYSVRAAPTFLINGQYIIKLESLRTEEQFKQLVVFLLQKSRDSNGVIIQIDAA
ncbi:thiol:disulfide interchange protein DsbA/DsbL [Aeromonas salmonicida]